MSNGENTGSGIPIIGPILNLLGSLFGGASQVQDLARGVSQVEKAAWANTFNLATWSFGLFGGILGTLGGLLKHLGELLRHVLVDLIFGHLRRILEAIKNWITNLRNWIRAHVAVLRQIQRNLDRARSLYMRKIIDIVQRIRKILVPFRLLHLRFARDLDARLAGFEGDLGKKWANLIRHQNAVLGVLDTIVDPRGLVRPGSGLATAGAVVVAVRGAIGALKVKDLLCLVDPVQAEPLIEPMGVFAAGVVDDVRHRRGDWGTLFVARDGFVARARQDLTGSGLV